MSQFLEFMKHPSKKIAASNQATPGVVGKVFDGIDGSLMAFWTCSETARPACHVHDSDECMVGIERCYTLMMDGRRVPLRRGDKCLIPRGVTHSGEVVVGARTIHVSRTHRSETAVPDSQTLSTSDVPAQ